METMKNAGTRRGMPALDADRSILELRSYEMRS